MHDKLNKTILISSYAPPSIGGPQNLYNLLRDTNPSSYCILTSYYNIDNISAKIGTWLKGEYIFYDSTYTTKNITNAPNDSIFKKRVIISKLKHFVKRSTIVRELTGVFIIFTQIVAIVVKGRKVIKSKNIDSIIGFSDYGPAMIGAYILHKITKKKYSIFLFDIYKGNFFPFPGNILANIFEPKIFRSANKIIVTNEGTRDFYIKRYGQNISEKLIVINNSAFENEYLKFKKPFEPKTLHTIVYTGRIYWPQIESLKNLIRAISEMKDLEIKLKIYSPHQKEYLKKIGIIESKQVELGVASPEEMSEIQSNADILFLPLSWHTKSQAIINTATPGKLTDYLIAGRPILIHAPASTFLAKYAKENNFAEVVDKENDEMLKAAIRKLIANKEYSDWLVANAKTTFYKNHNSISNSIEFQKILSN